LAILSLHPQNVSPQRNVPILPCSLANLTRFPQTRHLNTIHQQTKILSEGHWASAISAQNLHPATAYQIKLLPVLTHIFVSFLSAPH
jgi:hypothetical protein